MSAQPLNVFIGHDSREERAYGVCEASMRANSNSRLLVSPISSKTLPAGMYTRPQENRNGVLWDLISDAPMATEFSIARFFVPCVLDHGWAVFCDCDFLWVADIAELFKMRDDRYAVMVVKHTHKPTAAVKMDGQPQTIYRRKNWSSLMLLNCNAPEVRALTPAMLNEATGRSLHGFDWVEDHRIGELPSSWNWLEGEVNAVHYTRGTPDMVGYEKSAYHEKWWQYVAKD